MEIHKHSFARRAKLACEPQSMAKMRRQARTHAISLYWQRVVVRFAGLLMGALDEQDTARAVVAAATMHAMAVHY